MWTKIEYYAWKGRKLRTACVVGRGELTLEWLRERGARIVRIETTS